MSNFALIKISAIQQQRDVLQMCKIRVYYQCFWYDTSSFVRLSNHTNVEHFLGFCLGLQVFCQTGPPQWVDCLAPMGCKHKVFSHEHNDVLSVPESNQGLATFRSLAPRSTTELSPPHDTSEILKFYL